MCTVRSIEQRPSTKTSGTIGDIGVQTTPSHSPDNHHHHHRTSDSPPTSSLDRHFHTTVNVLLINTTGEQKVTGAGVFFDMPSSPTMISEEEHTVIPPLPLIPQVLKGGNGMNQQPTPIHPTSTLIENVNSTRSNSHPTMINTPNGSNTSNSLIPNMTIDLTTSTTPPPLGNLTLNEPSTSTSIYSVSTSPAPSGSSLSASLSLLQHSRTNSSPGLAILLNPHSHGTPKQHPANSSTNPSGSPSPTPLLLPNFPSLGATIGHDLSPVATAASASTTSTTTPHSSHLLSPPLRPRSQTGFNSASIGTHAAPLEPLSPALVRVRSQLSHSVSVNFTNGNAAAGSSGPPGLPRANSGNGSTSGNGSSVSSGPPSSKDFSSPLSSSFNALIAQGRMTRSNSMSLASGGINSNARERSSSVILPPLAPMSHPATPGPDRELPTFLDLESSTLDDAPFALPPQQQQKLANLTAGHGKGVSMRALSCVASPTTSDERVQMSWLPLSGLAATASSTTPAVTSNHAHLYRPRTPPAFPNDPRVGLGTLSTHAVHSNGGGRSFSPELDPSELALAPDIAGASEDNLDSYSPRLGDNDEPPPDMRSPRAFILPAASVTPPITIVQNTPSLLTAQILAAAARTPDRPINGVHHHAPIHAMHSPPAKPMTSPGHHSHFHPQTSPTAAHPSASFSLNHPPMPMRESTPSPGSILPDTWRPHERLAPSLVTQSRSLPMTQSDHLTSAIAQVAPLGSSSSAGASIAPSSTIRAPAIRSNANLRLTSAFEFSKVPTATGPGTFNNNPLPPRVKTPQLMPSAASPSRSGLAPPLDCTSPRNTSFNSFGTPFSLSDPREPRPSNSPPSPPQGSMQMGHSPTKTSEALRKPRTSIISTAPSIFPTF